MASSSLWQRFQQYFLRHDDLDFSIDISRVKFPDDFFDKMRPRIDKAFTAMRDLEAGGIANPDEKRMVGHYWLRKPALAPNAELRAEIENTKVAAAKNFSTFSPSELAAPHLGRSSSPTRSGQRRIRRTFTSSTTPTRMDSTVCSIRSTMSSGARLSWSFRNRGERKKHGTECWKQKRASKLPDWILLNTRLQSPASAVISISSHRKMDGWRVSRCGIGSAAALR